jgi:hypothetical protein
MLLISQDRPARTVGSFGNFLILLPARRPAAIAHMRQPAQKKMRADPCICREPLAEVMTPKVAMLDRFVPGAAKLGLFVAPWASIRI